jgi:hypothetical protein
MWTALVTLPSFVHTSVRSARSSRAWSTEVTAVKDAAFEAYVALYNAKLVNDNMLPFTHEFVPEVGQDHLDQPTMVDVSDSVSAWQRLFNSRKTHHILWHLHLLSVSLEDAQSIELQLYLPDKLSQPLAVELHFNCDVMFTATITPLSSEPLHCSDEELTKLQNFTRNVLRTVHAHNLSNSSDFAFLLSTVDSSSTNMSLEGSVSLNESSITLCQELCGLLRTKLQTGRAFFLSTFDNTAVSDAEVHAVAFPRRKDFLHRPPDGEGRRMPSFSFPASECTIDRLPSRYAILAALLPSILHRVELALNAQQFQRIVLPNIPFHNMALVMEAMAAPSSREGFDYNRIEFLGDTVLVLTNSSFPLV